MVGVRRAGRQAAQFILFFGLLFSFAGCESPGRGAPGERSVGEGRVLIVYAAASLKGAFDEIARQFEIRHSGSKVLVSFAGSQQLAQQIAQGASVDVFASANDRQMAVAVESGRIDPAAPQVFIQNRLVVILPQENPGALSQLTDMARPGLRVLLADEKVPVGRYAAQFLDAASQDLAFGREFETGVRRNIVSFEENVRAVTSKVALGEADAGVVYMSDYVSAPSGTLQAVPIPDHLNPRALYPLAPLVDAANPDLAGAFIAFVLEPVGQEILTEYGYLPLTER